MMIRRGFLIGIGCLVAFGLVGRADARPMADRTGSLAELPDWPVGFKLPEQMTAGWRRAQRIEASPKAHVLVWTPPGATVVRAVLLMPNNTDSKHIGEHAAVRQVAARHGMGVVYLRQLDGTVVERSDPPTEAGPTLDAMLALVAEKTGVASYRHAPWITLGKSSRGRFPFRCAWWMPDRVIATISWHGETPTWPMADWSRVTDQSILHLSINGQSEWEGTWYRHVRPALLNYHAQTNWLAHQVVLPGIGHGDYRDGFGIENRGKAVRRDVIGRGQVWDYVAVFIDRALKLRLPEDADPTDGPVRLRQVDRDAGVLVHPRAVAVLGGYPQHALRRDEEGTWQVIPWPAEPSPVVEPDPQPVAEDQLVRPAAEVPEDQRRGYFWVADMDQARAWRQVVSPVAPRQAVDRRQAHDRRTD